MASEVLPGLGSHHNQVGVRFLGCDQDFLDDRTKGHSKLRFAPVFNTLRHQLLHPPDIDFLLSRNTLFAVRRGTLKHMEQRQVCPMLLRKGESIRSGSFRSRPEIRCEQNIIEFNVLPSLTPYGWANSQNRRVRLAENLLRDRAD